MLIRNSIAITKKIFQKTLKTFKSFIAKENYQKLPKTPPSNPYYKELETFYSEFTEKWDSKTIKMKKKTTSTTKNIQTLDEKNENNVETRENYEEKREESRCFVARKIKEMEMIDMENVDHLMDIEEILHYYSLLTCPTYLHIVDKFFMEIYAEFIDNSLPSSAQ